MTHHAGTRRSGKHWGTQCKRALEIDDSHVTQSRKIFRSNLWAYLLQIWENGIPYPRGVYPRWIKQSPSDVSPLENGEKGEILWTVWQHTAGQCPWPLTNQWVGAVRQYAITWANVDPYLSPYGITRLTQGARTLEVIVLTKYFQNFLASVPQGPDALLVEYFVIDGH